MRIQPFDTPLSRSVLTDAQREFAQSGFGAWSVAKDLRRRLCQGHPHSFSTWDLGRSASVLKVCLKGAELGIWEKTQWAEVFNYTAYVLPWIEECEAAEEKFQASPEAQRIHAMIFPKKTTKDNE